MVSDERLEEFADIVRVWNGPKGYYRDLVDLLTELRERRRVERDIESYLRSQLEIARQMTCEDDFEKGRKSGMEAAIVDCLDWLKQRKEAT